MFTAVTLPGYASLLEAATRHALTSDKSIFAGDRRKLPLISLTSSGIWNMINLSS